MKKILILLILTVPAFSAMAQCPTGHLDLASQADVDAFVSEYPNCSELPGDLIISSSTGVIDDLSGLSQIISINGKLYIPAIFFTPSLAGLENIQSARSVQIGPTWFPHSNPYIYVDLQPLGNISGHLDSLLIGGVSAESFGTEFPHLTSVGYLQIMSNQSLTQLPAFPGLTAVRNFWIRSNPMLQQITIPENISAMGYEADPDSIFSFPPGILIDGNQNLQSITSNASFPSVHDMIIRWNAQLHTINGFASLERIYDELTFFVNHPSALNAFPNVTQVGDAEIELNSEGVVEPQGDIFLALGATADNLTTGDFKLNTGLSPWLAFPAQLTTVSGNMSVTTSATYFQPLNYLTSIGGYLRLRIPGRTQLPAMPQLTSIGGYIDFHFFSEAANLLNFEGLNALTTVGGNFRIGKSWPPTEPFDLTSLNGLESLTEIGGHFSILNLENLEDVSALQNLTTVSGRFQLENLPLISEDDVELPNLTTVGDLIIDEMPFVNIPVFPALTILGGNLSLLNNAALVSTGNLSAIASIGGNITVKTNALLSDFILHTDIDFSGNFILTDNPALDNCGNNIVCTLVNLANTSEISGNGNTCATLDEILAACVVSTSNAEEAGMRIYQDANNQIVIQTDHNFGQAEISLFDLQGRMLYQTQNNLSEGNYLITLPGNVAHGIYVVSVEGKKERVAGKISIGK